MEPAVASAAQVTCRAEAETFVLLLYHRLPLMEATATGSLVVEGDGELTAAFDRWLQGDEGSRLARNVMPLPDKQPKGEQS